VKDFGDMMKRLKAYPFSPEHRIPPSEEEVARYERHIGAVLPEPFRSFCSMYAGIGFEIDVVGSCLDDRIEDGFVAISLIYGFYRSGKRSAVLRDLLANYTESRKVDNFPWIPIIECPYGNQIVMSIGGSDKGCLYFLDHEEFPEVDPEPVRSEGVYLVDRSFEAFLKSVRPYEDE
jgi:hypothetical protein